MKSWREQASQLSKDLFGVTAPVLSPTRFLLDLVELVAERATGRELEIRAGDTTYLMRLERLRCRHEGELVPPGLLASQIRDLGGMSDALDLVEVEASDVRWDEGRIDHLTVDLHQLRLEPGLRPVAVASPVDLTATLEQPTVDEWVASQEPGFRVALTGHGLVAVRHPTWEWIAQAMVKVHLDDDEVRAELDHLALFGGGLRLPRFLSPRRSVSFPRRRGPVEITSIDAEPGRVRVHARVEEVRQPIQGERLAMALTSAGARVILPIG